MINIEHVSKSYGSKAAVNDISFNVQEGEHLVLLGTSGCGKTTTLKMINRLIEATSGTISVNGKNIKEQSPEVLRRGIGYVLQHNSLFPHYTIAENISVVPKLIKWSKAKIETRTAELMEKLHLPQQFLSKYPHELSGGEAQRVNLARALVADPPILLMDEPFGALDPVTRVAIRNEFSALDELRRKTIIMVTHDVHEAFELGHNICLMDDGKIKQIGTPAALLFHPANEFVMHFFAGANMQLGLSITKVHDLWHYLPSGNNDLSNVKPMNANTSIWSIMEQITEGDQTLVQVQSTDESAVKNISVSDLLEAFNRYKKQS